MIKVSFNIPVMKPWEWKVAIFLVLAGTVNPGYAQFVEFHLSIPAGRFVVESETLSASEFRPNGLPPNHNVTRVGITARENIPVLVEWMTENGGVTGRTDIIRAHRGYGDREDLMNTIPFDQYRALFRLSPLPLLIDRLPGAPVRLTAWLFFIPEPEVETGTGESSTDTVHVKITYL